MVLSKILSRAGVRVKLKMWKSVLYLKTKAREEFVNITSEVRNFVRNSGIKRGHLLIFVPHTTAAITINEGADPSVIQDLKYILQKLVPCDDPSYRHLEGNSDAHGKASLLGSSLSLIVEEGELFLGTWQSIFFAEFDGPRQRQVHLSLISSPG